MKMTPIQRWGALVVVLGAVLGSASSASAYAWMNRHDYGACATCHADPSGSGLLTLYGRAQSDLLLSTDYSASGDESGGDLGTFQNFLFGLVDLPNEVLAGGWIRNGYIWSHFNGKLADERGLFMRADLAAQVKIDAVRFHATLGVATADSATLSQRAQLTSNEDSANLVSREHWVGLDLLDDEMLLRAGRLNLPFGLRIIEHTAWVRSETQTDVNQHQQHGIAAAYNDSDFRTEVMVVLGNFQVSPDDYRDRGYTGYLEYHAATGLDVGVSSQILHAARDLNVNVENTRQAHGLFFRAAPDPIVALLAEFDVMLQSPSGGDTEAGFVGMLQADAEPIRGVHLIAMGEVLRRPQANADTNWGAWGGAQWFVYPHLDVRGDLIYRTTSTGSNDSLVVLLQFHGYI